jgi:hypothetical protein
MRRKCLVPDRSPATAYRWGCRCRRCREWNAETHRAALQRARLRARAGTGCQFPDHTPSTAYQYGCRCIRCNRANTARCLRWRHGKQSPPA